MERLGRMTDAGRAVLPDMHDKGGTIWNVIVHRGGQFRRWLPRKALCHRVL